MISEAQGQKCRLALDITGSVVKPNRNGSGTHHWFFSPKGPRLYHSCDLGGIITSQRSRYVCLFLV